MLPGGNYGTCIVSCWVGLGMGGGGGLFPVVLGDIWEMSGFISDGTHSVIFIGELFVSNSWRSKCVQLKP